MEIDNIDYIAAMLAWECRIKAFVNSPGFVKDPANIVIMGRWGADMPPSYGSDFGSIPISAESYPTMASMG